MNLLTGASLLALAKSIWYNYIDDYQKLSAMIGWELASSHHNHCAVIITMKASSFQNGSQIC